MLISIQIARAVAVLAVMIRHLEWVYNDFHGTAAGWTSPLLLVGGQGVDLFFVISGFIIAYLISEREWSARDFYLRRFIRIYPMYWFFTLSFAAAVTIGCRTGQRAECASVFDLNSMVSSLLILPQNGYPVLSVGWSLEHEIIFYGIAGAICVAARLPIRALLYALVGLGCIGIVTDVIVPTIIGRPGPWLFHFFSLYHFEFAAGIAVFLYKDQLTRLNPLALLVIGAAGFYLTFVAVLLVPGLDVSVETWKGGLPGLVSVVGYAAASAAIIGGLLGAEQRGYFRSGARLWLWVVAGLVAVGNASYGLYLMQPLAYGVIGKVFGALDFSAAFIVPAMIVATGITLVVGWLWYSMVERPFLQIAHRAIATPRAPKAQA